MINLVSTQEVQALFPPLNEVDSPLNRAHERLNPDDALCFETEDPELILQARKLTAQVYLKLGFVKAEDIEDEVIKPSVDPYVDCSRYYVVTDPTKENVLATVRTIQYDPVKGEESFPLFKYASELDEDRLQELREYGVENLIEVSALARDDNYDEIKGTAALKLYKEIFFGADNEHGSKEPVFVMACSPKLWKKFQLLFDGAIHRIGPDLKYPGQKAVPAALPIGDAPETVITESRNEKNPLRGVYERVVNYFLSGYGTNVLDDRAVAALKSNGYEDLLAKMESGQWTDNELSASLALEDITRNAMKGKFEQFTKKFWPELVGGAGLALYTGARTYAVAKGVDTVAHTDWRVFLGIELGTTPQYMWGIGDLLRGAVKSETYSRVRKTVASVAVGSAFVAPYAYLAANGAVEDLQSAAISGGILAIGLGALYKSVRKIAKTWRKRSSESGGKTGMIKHWDVYTPALPVTTNEDVSEDLDDGDNAPNGVLYLQN